MIFEYFKVKLSKIFVCKTKEEKENFWKVSFPSNILLLIVVENQSKENIIFQST